MPFHWIWRSLKWRFLLRLHFWAKVVTKTSGRKSGNWAGPGLSHRSCACILVCFLGKFLLSVWTKGCTEKSAFPFKCTQLSWCLQFSELTFSVSMQQAETKMRQCKDYQAQEKRAKCKCQERQGRSAVAHSRSGPHCRLKSEGHRFTMTIKYGEQVSQALVVLTDKNCKQTAHFWLASKIEPSSFHSHRPTPKKPKS